MLTKNNDAMNSLKNATILAIDDEPQILSLLNKMLANQCKNLIVEHDANQALALMQNTQPDLLLLDIMMQKNCGYEICQQIKANQHTEHIPVIFLSSLALSDDKVKGFEVGGVDFITKPFDIAEVIACIKSCLKTHQKIPTTSQVELLKNAQFLEKYSFNKHELAILHLYIAGYKRSEIAEKTNLSENTVKWYLKQIFQKFHIASRAELIEKAREMGM